MADDLIHGTGRVPSSIPRGHKRNLEGAREQLSSIKRFQSVQVRPHNKPNDESVFRTQSVIVHSSRNYQEKNKAPKVYGADVDLQRIDEKFRNRTDDTKTTIITATRIQDDDDDDFFAIDCDELTRMLEDGPIKFRFLVIIGALFMAIGSVIDYHEQKSYNNYGSGGMTPLFFIITLYVWIFGAFIISLEIKPFHMGVSAFHRIILDQLNILRFTWGRGLFYIFSGSLQFSLFTKWNMIAGGCMICLGLVSIVIGRMASTKLKKLVRRIGNKHNLSESFAFHDKDRDGCLSVREFRSFVRDMNVNLTDEELHNAFLAIDTDNDRFMTYSDISNWYADAKYEIKTDGLII